MTEKKSETAVLVVNLSGSQRVELRCRKGEIIIGRSSACDLIIPAPSVSRKHARIVGTDYGYFLEDLSKNGTYIDGKRIRKETLAKNTDITIGPYLLHFMISPYYTPSEDEKPTDLFDRDSSTASHPKEEKLDDFNPYDSSAIGILGKSQEIRKMIELMQKVAETDFPVLVMGETGTGKELVARGIHRLSKRRAGPFVAINCSAIVSGLVESELFGHEKGSFTGSLGERKGAFEIAQGGTILLDEIGEMPTEIQPKLLRTLEDSQIRKIGGNAAISVNVRIIAATNRQLSREIEEKKFRKDLFYRLNTFPIIVPPLRERLEDVGILTAHFLEHFSWKYERNRRIGKKGMKLLKKHTWPGNVRELKNVLNRAAIMATEEEIDAFILEDVLGKENRNMEQSSQEGLSGQFMRKIDLAEKETIVDELKRTGWNKTQAAKNLGIAKSTLFDKLRRYNIQGPDHK